jgi:hypothetical protein
MTKEERIKYILTSALIIAAIIFAYFACSYIEFKTADDYNDVPLSEMVKREVGCADDDNKFTLENEDEAN